MSKEKSDKCGTCGEHGSLTNDVKWITKLMGIGFALVLSAVVYFNVTLQKGMEKVYITTTEIKVSFLEKSYSHELDLRAQGLRLDAIETLCCTVADSADLSYNEALQGISFIKDIERSN